jgi:predicted ATP-grasp superfamily ATP-dependent carboligase
MPVLIAAFSGRALAAAACRAGDSVVVADLFGDADTRRLAPWLQMPGDLVSGIDGEALRERIAAAGPLEGIVYGAGFEARPALLRELAEIAPLVGNDAATVAAVKDPVVFAGRLAALGLPHPPVATQPGDGVWMRKRRGASGGFHVRYALGDDAVPAEDVYFQRLAAGQPLSALFLADGSKARLLGLSRQWADPSVASPFRYGGSAGPIDVSPLLTAEIASACSALAASLGLRGLNSLDMLVEGASWTILEINPRPGATLDIFDDASGRLWRWHRDAIAGELPSESAVASLPLRAAAILYAEAATTIPSEMTWADWVADIPTAGSGIAVGAPICTILASGRDVAAARAELDARAGRLRRRLGGPHPFSFGKADAHEPELAS